MLTQLITETLLGALTGYVTNHTAIRSLFQPGGVIEQTREEFAREAGRLLEEQVLTQAVLQQQLQLPEVQQKLAEALEAFLQRELPQALQQQNSLRCRTLRSALLFCRSWRYNFCSRNGSRFCCC